MPLLARGVRLCYDYCRNVRVSKGQNAYNPASSAGGGR